MSEKSTSIHAVAANWDRQVLAPTSEPRVQVRVFPVADDGFGLQPDLNAFLAQLDPRRVVGVSLGAWHALVMFLDDIRQPIPDRGVDLADLGLPEKVRRCLMQYRITTVDEALSRNSDQLARLRNFGPAAFVSLHDALVEAGYIEGSPS